jgi:adenosylcobyric acid synthase
MKTVKNIMVQGTASSVGKSIITAGLCRIFTKDGYKTVPFKSQNMALNSYVTIDGKEMGRAQAMQALAAGIEPEVEMNPILLKPVSHTGSQVVLEGKPVGNYEALKYFEYRNSLKEIILRNYNHLAAKNNIIVIEGAGSPAEINLRENDVVNMGMAEMVNAPVVLIGDIDRGGVFASLAGTLLLLTEEERKRVKGVIINKFRGDVKILEPGLKMLEDIIKIPVLGVIPYFENNLDDEDSVSEKIRTHGKNTNKPLKIRIIRLPHLSNYTDFTPLVMYDDADVQFISRAEETDGADMLIIPGSKSAIDDLLFLYNRGFKQKIEMLHNGGCLIIGICGGFQMLGLHISDPYQVESSITRAEGLGLLPIITEMEEVKTTIQTRLQIKTNHELLSALNGSYVSGYEIHMGKTIAVRPVETFLESDGERLTGISEGNVIGTYMHGIFDNTELTDLLLNSIRRKKNLPEQTSSAQYQDQMDMEFGRLEMILRDHLDMEAIYRILLNK